MESVVGIFGGLCGAGLGAGVSLEKETFELSLSDSRTLFAQDLMTSLLEKNPAGNSSERSKLH